ncbi:hypothetical protein F5Y07DRAFT_411122 [Xylaria sp. FL0933]|nr:hypothetical protein F5Y07DRAFT_411122 [Xylaria sp. FL0933]
MDLNYGTPGEDPMPTGLNLPHAQDETDFDGTTLFNEAQCTGSFESSPSAPTASDAMYNSPFPLDTPVSQSTRETSIESAPAQLSGQWGPSSISSTGFVPDFDFDAFFIGDSKAEGAGGPPPTGEQQSTEPAGKPKRKRENRYKNAPPAVISRRRAQNRASQRAYRERKDQRIKALEESNTQLEKRIEQLTILLTNERNKIQRLLQSQRTIQYMSSGTSPTIGVNNGMVLNKNLALNSSMAFHNGMSMGVTMGGYTPPNNNEMAFCGCIGGHLPLQQRCHRPDEPSPYMPQEIPWGISARSEVHTMDSPSVATAEDDTLGTDQIIE